MEVGKVAIMVVASVLLIAATVLVQQCDGSKILAGVVPSSAQYRAFPFTFEPPYLEAIADRLDLLLYSHASFELNTFQVFFGSQDDEAYLEHLAHSKELYPDLKVILTIGGEDFPSSSFSAMASSIENRTMFIANLQEVLIDKSLDGININWQWPCSDFRVIFKRKYKTLFTGCDSYEEVIDEGSQCPEDADNFLLLLKELREWLGDSTLITVTASPSPKLFRQLPLWEMEEYVDYWMLQTYDYTESATKESGVTAPIAPLRHLAREANFNTPSINITVRGYLKRGVPAENIIIGIPFHGNLWYVPVRQTVPFLKWDEFGVPATIQGKCCGPYQPTFGAKHGRASQRCGTYLFSEIKMAAADMMYHYDKSTQTAIGYVDHDSTDGWTEAGTWFSFSDRNSAQVLTQYIKKMGLGGAYASDISADSINLSSKHFTFELMMTLYSGLKGDGDSTKICDPTVGCNVSALDAATPS